MALEMCARGIGRRVVGNLPRASEAHLLLIKSGVLWNRIFATAQHTQFFLSIKYGTGPFTLLYTPRSAHRAADTFLGFPNLYPPPFFAKKMANSM